MLVSRAPMLLAIPFGQGVLVSRFLAISGAASGWKASMFSSSLTGSALAQLLSISPLLQVLINVQACLSTFLPLDTCTQTSPHAASLEHSGAGKPVFLGQVRWSVGSQAASPRFCSSTPMLLPQEWRRSFLHASAPAGLQWGSSELTLSVLRCSVVPLHTGLPYSGYKSSWRNTRLGETCWTHVQLALMSPTANSSSCRCRHWCSFWWTTFAAFSRWCLVAVSLSYRCHNVKHLFPSMSQ